MMANVSTIVPTTMEELTECNIPQNVQKQYGERLIKSINAYIEQCTLHQYIENRPKKKQKTSNVENNTKSSKPVLIDVPDSEDEFGDDAIFSAISMPGQISNVPNNNATKPNPYSQKSAAATKPASKKGSKLKSRKSSYF